MASHEIEEIFAEKMAEKLIFIVQKHPSTATVSLTPTMTLLRLSYTVFGAQGRGGETTGRGDVYILGCHRCKPSSPKLPSYE